MRRILLAALLAMPALVSFDSASLAQGINSSPRTIDVTGHGDSSAKPDMMTLSFTVTAHSDSADECTRNESEKSRQVIDALKAKLGDSARSRLLIFLSVRRWKYGNAMATPTPIEQPSAACNLAVQRLRLNVYTESIDPIADLIETGWLRALRL